MYDVNYSYKESISDKGEKRETIIKVKFRFKQEVAPQERKEIRNRIKYKKGQKDYNQNQGNIISYLESKQIQAKYNRENWRGDHEIGYFEKQLGGNLAKIDVKSLSGKLGINLKIEVQGKHALEEVLNPKELNNFILTGESN